MDTFLVDLYDTYMCGCHPHWVSGNKSIALGFWELTEPFLIGFVHWL